MFLATTWEKISGQEARDRGISEKRPFCSEVKTRHEIRGCFLAAVKQLSGFHTLGPK